MFSGAVSKPLLDSIEQQKKRIVMMTTIMVPFGELLDGKRLTMEDVLLKADDLRESMATTIASISPNVIKRSSVTIVYRNLTDLVAITEQSTPGVIKVQMPPINNRTIPTDNVDNASKRAALYKRLGEQSQRNNELPLAICNIATVGMSVGEKNAPAKDAILIMVLTMDSNQHFAFAENSYTGQMD
jgi:hypothetical protein